MKDWWKAQPPAARALLLTAFVLALGVVAAQVFASDNTLAGGILQALTFMSGTAGSFIAGKSGAEEAGKAFVKPHADSAFRRVLNLYEALGRQGQAIVVERQTLADAAGEDGKVLIAQVDASFRALELMVIEQSATANDAMEDWRSLVPEQVGEIDAAVREREGELGDG